MSFEVITTEPFKRKFKKLAKKHPSLKNDLASLIDSLSGKPKQGIHMGSNCYKVGMAIAPKGKCKFGGADLCGWLRSGSCAVG